MTEATDTGESEPKLLTVALTSQDPRQQSDEIAAAVHEYITVYRDPPRFLVLHPEDHARIAPHFQHERSLTPDAAIAHRIQPTLGRGAFLLADTDDPAWESPAAG